MREEGRIFEALGKDDAVLAAEVATRLAMTLPQSCRTGVAFNARLMQAHFDTLTTGRP